MPETSDEEQMQSNQINSGIKRAIFCRAAHIADIWDMLKDCCSVLIISSQAFEVAKKCAMCIGDVGSLLITKNREIVGIASWRGSNCGSGSPDVYTRVFPHLNWIWENIIDANCT